MIRKLQLGALWPTTHAGGYSDISRLCAVRATLMSSWVSVMVVIAKAVVSGPIVGQILALMRRGYKMLVRVACRYHIRSVRHSCRWLGRRVLSQCCHG